jgi:hypothetical protein
MSPTHIALTSGFPEYASENSTSPPDGRHADGVAVPPDAAHDLAEQVAVALLLQRPEA